MTLTKAQRKRLAKAARELASEFAEGRGPHLDSWTWCGCAAGQMFKRAGIDNTNGSNAADLDYGLGHILTGATAAQLSIWCGELPTPGAVVFPLLYVADWLEVQP